MSLQLIRTQIDKFLETDTPEVMAIRGAWGVGKTFAWNKYLKEAKDDDGIALNSYSYVSLFGVNSLDELKLAAFLGGITKKHIGTEQDLDVSKSVDKKFSSLIRKSLKLLKVIPWLKDIRPSIESAAFYALRKAIVCIDDFERKGKDLDAQDIMGLVNSLKEQKQCKVVLILNDEKLKDAALIDYETYREKVIDIELEFSPSASECAGIALPTDAWSLKLRNFVEQLGINNIRIIKKIERLSTLIRPLLFGLEEAVVNRALQSLTLFAWSFYGRQQGAPEFEFIKKIQDEFVSAFSEERQLSAEEQGWRAILWRYDFYYCTEFDLQLALAVERGYLDEGPFMDEALKRNEEAMASSARASFKDALSTIYDSFDKDADEIVAALYDNFEKNIKHIGVDDLDRAVRFYRQLGNDELADNMIDRYAEERRDDEKLFSLGPLYRQIKDQRVVEVFAAIRESQKNTRSLKDVVRRIAANSYSPEDEQILARTNPDEYYELFKNERGSNLLSYVDACLSFGQIVNATEEQKRIAERAAAALRKIGEESDLNAMRVRRLGVKLETKSQETASS